MLPIRDHPGMAEARILVVDDDERALNALTETLRRVGYPRVDPLPRSDAVVDWIAYSRPDLLILDLHMPEPDGFQVMEQVKALLPPDEYFPILVITGDLDDEVRIKALAAGAKDFLTKPYEVMEALLRVRNLLETRYLHMQLRTQNDRLEEAVRERTRELADTQVEILQRLALAAEYRDDQTGRHAQRVGALSAHLARGLGLPRTEVQVLRQAAPLHDIGKIGIPDAILLKPTPLTEEEFRIMRSHTEIGADMLSNGRFPLLRCARLVAHNHHEHWDGRGYHGLGGPEIPLAGRIVAVADAFDVITSERPYKAPSPFRVAVQRIQEGAGTHFDPEVVEVFLDAVRGGWIVAGGASGYGWRLSDEDSGAGGAAGAAMAADAEPARLY